MKYTTVSLREIVGHKIARMDVAYWAGKKNGKKAYKETTGGQLVEDDISGKIIASEEDATQYNDLKKQETDAIEKSLRIKKKISGLNILLS